MAANNNNSNSPRQPGDTVGSPQSRRAARVVSSPSSSSPSSQPPWTQIVRGESEPTIAAAVAAATSSPVTTTSTSSPAAAIEAAAPSALAAAPPSPTLAVDESIAESSENGNGGKRPAWNKPSNGAVAEVGPVMGAVSWPALSESTRAPAKSPSDSIKPSSDGSSTPASQVCFFNHCELLFFPTLWIGERLVARKM